MLGELIKVLEAEDPSLVVPMGFSDAHSYRGDYAQLGVKPTENVTVAEMLITLRGALGKPFIGYKGGEFVMHEYTDVYLAEWSCTGEQLGPRFLALMLKDAKRCD